MDLTEPLLPTKGRACKPVFWLVCAVLVCFATFFSGLEHFRSPNTKEIEFGQYQIPIQANRNRKRRTSIESEKVDWKWKELKENVLQSAYEEDQKQDQEWREFKKSVFQSTQTEHQPTMPEKQSTQRSGMNRMYKSKSERMVHSEPSGNENAQKATPLMRETQMSRPSVFRAGKQERTGGRIQSDSEGTEEELFPSMRNEQNGRGKGWLSDAWNDVKQKASDAWDALKGKAQALKDKVKDMLGLNGPKEGFTFVKDVSTHQGHIRALTKDRTGMKLERNDVWKPGWGWVDEDSTFANDPRYKNTGADSMDSSNKMPGDGWRKGWMWHTKGEDGQYPYGRRRKLQKGSHEDSMEFNISS